MRTRIVKIGNSQGVRIPKALLLESGLEGEVEISVKQGSLVIASVSKPREGWDDAFAAMARHGDDELLDGGAPVETSFDDEDWQWT